MFLNIWTYMRGYVAVEVTGPATERLLNMAAHRGVYIWNVTHTEKGRIRMHCSIQGFRRLTNLLRKTKCRVRIVDKQGLPFTMYRYRKRKILMGGIVFFVLSMYMMSAFIWHIEILGNERLHHEEILEFVQGQGLSIGVFKRQIDHDELSQQLLRQFPDIGWVDVHTRGTRTTVLISETIPEPTRVPRDVPCNIVASRDGLITGIVTGAGIPQVRQNDVVREGDILVSGIVPLHYEHTGQSVTHYVHAYAEVWAKMYTPIRFAIPLTYDYKQYTGNIHTQHTLQILIGRNYSINIFHGRIPYTNYDRIVSHTQLGSTGDYPLPFIWVTTTYREFEPITRERTIEEAKILAERVITERIIREFDFQTDIIDKQVQFMEESGQLVVSALITTNERIDRAVPIDTPPADTPITPTENTGT